MVVYSQLLACPEIRSSVFSDGEASLMIVLDVLVIFPQVKQKIKQLWDEVVVIVF